MKNKILSYLLGWILVLFMGFVSLWVQAQEETKEEPKRVWGDCHCLTNDQACIEKNCKKDEATEEKECNGIRLNTDFPLVGNCIELHKSEWWTWTNTLNAFSTMVWSLMSIVTSLILIICFIMLIMAWIKRSSNDPKAARDLIKKVAITVLLLWLSGVILKVINPTFFW
jgi:hypothetical protein